MSINITTEGLGEFDRCNLDDHIHRIRRGGHSSRLFHGGRAHYTKENRDWHGQGDATSPS
jgi:hypothetical protein